MRRLALAFAVSGALVAVAPATAAAQGPPAPPPGCNVVITTPAFVTGSAAGQANKVDTYIRLCL